MHPSPAPLPGASRTLLLVDDESPILRALTRLLADDGYRILTAGSGPAALALLETQPVAVVVSDQRMPGMSGAELLARVRERHPDAVRMVLSASSDIDTVTRAVNDGAVYKYFLKPWDDERLRAGIREAFQRYGFNARNTQFAAAFQSAIEGIMITDPEGVIQAVNPAFTAITGYLPAEAIGRTPRLLRSGQHGTDFYEGLWAGLRASGHWQGEIWNRRKNGEVYPEWLTITAITDGAGRPVQYMALFTDISGQKASEAQLHHQAQHDALTGLPNRPAFQRRLEEALAGGQGGSALAVLVLDLDRFKTVNNGLGHTAGDRLLLAVARRLAPAVGEGILARLGGDEFAVFLAAEAAEAARAGERILQRMREPLAAGESEVFLAISIGVSLHPGDGDDAESLIQNAESAMYRAKAQGGDRLRFYTAELGERVQTRLTLETRLRRALEREELLLYYQPQVELAGGRRRGAEALLRWRDPDGRLISPAEFIPLLEETGLIVPVGDWVLRRACAQCRAWRAGGLADMRVAVNLSARQFREGDIVAMVGRALGESGLAAGGLELEITESVVMDDAEAAARTMSRLKDMGVALSVDDFGTGFSSLAYLRRLPLTALKIDRQFVRDIPQNTDDALIVESIIGLAHGLRLEVIAEGVENEAQRAFLRERGCDLGQGYLFGAPMPAETLLANMAGGLHGAHVAAG